MLKRVLEVGAKKTIQKLSHLGPRHEVPNETAFVDYYIYIYIYICSGAGESAGSGALRHQTARGRTCARAVRVFRGHVMGLYLQEITQGVLRPFEESLLGHQLAFGSAYGCAV